MSLSLRCRPICAFKNRRKNEVSPSVGFTCLLRILSLNMLDNGVGLNLIFLSLTYSRFTTTAGARLWILVALRVALI